MVQLRRIATSPQYLSVLARSKWLSELASQSLIAEAELTPKPGLVDGRGSGSHSDLSLDAMRRSADAIAPYFTRMAFASAGVQPDANLRAVVASIGREAETAMLRATSGSNAHKGAIWVLGLLVCAASLSEDAHPELVAEAAGYLVYPTTQDHGRYPMVTSSLNDMGPPALAAKPTEIFRTSST
jgi:triphosphoribosyl-dephospho-CoA synthase